MRRTVKLPSHPARLYYTSTSPDMVSISRWISQGHITGYLCVRSSRGERHTHKRFSISKSKWQLTLILSLRQNFWSRSKRTLSLNPMPVQFEECRKADASCEMLFGSFLFKNIVIELAGQSSTFRSQWLNFLKHCFTSERSLDEPGRFVKHADYQNDADTLRAIWPKDGEAETLFRPLWMKKCLGSIF